MDVMIVHAAGDEQYRRSMIRALMQLAVMVPSVTVVTVDRDPVIKEVMSVDEDSVLKDISVDDWMESFSNKYIRKVTMLDLVDRPSAIGIDINWNYHHDYNLTAPTTTFDRQQQRRKALAKQHFVKPMKKAKKREKTHVKVSWR